MDLQLLQFYSCNRKTEPHQGAYILLLATYIERTATTMKKNQEDGTAPPAAAPSSSSSSSSSRTTTTYVTWYATLHPEEYYTIDNMDDAESKVQWIPDDEVDIVADEPDLPTAVPVAPEEEGGASPPPPPSAAAAAAAVAASTSAPKKKKQQPRGSWKHRSPADTAVGALLLLAAVVATSALELAAAILYLLSALLHRGTANDGCTQQPSGNTVAAFLCGLCAILSMACLVSDSVLLVASVLVTEVLAAAACAVSCLLGGVHRALLWHQHIRRTCHACRCFSRSRFAQCTPPRHHFLSLGSSRKRTEEETAATTATQEPEKPAACAADAGGDVRVPPPRPSAPLEPADSVVVVIDDKDVTIVK
jgi:hypothetical protein